MDSLACVWYGLGNIDPGPFPKNIFSSVLPVVKPKQLSLWVFLFFWLGWVLVAVSGLLFLVVCGLLTAVAPLV